MTNAARPRRIPSWVVAVAGIALGAVLGAGMVTAGAQDEPAPGTDRGGRRAAIEAFVACAEDAGIDLPDRSELRRHRRTGTPLSDASRQAIRDAREACGDLLPHAEERAAVRTCLTGAGVLPADGSRPDRSSMIDDERARFREALRTCADEAGVTLPRRCRPRLRADG